MELAMVPVSLGNISTPANHSAALSPDPIASNGPSPGTFTVRMIFVVAMVVFSIAGFFGNALIILTIFLVGSLRSTRNAFLVNLAVSDLTLIAIIVPFNIVSVLQGEPYWHDRMTLCQFVASICAPGCLSAIWSNTGVAFNRYFFICRNESYHKYFTPAKTLLWIMALWALSFGIHLPNHLGWGHSIYVEHFFLCTRETNLASYSVFFSAVGIVLPLAISFLAYCRIYALVRTTRSARNHILGVSCRSQVTPGTLSITEKDPVTGGTRQSSVLSGGNQLALLSIQSQQPGFLSVPQKFRSEIRLVKTLFRSFAVFVVAWLPLAVLLMLSNLNAPTWVYLLTVFLAHGSTATNSILYFMTNDDFRRGFRSAVRTVLRNRSVGGDLSSVAGGPGTRTLYRSPSKRRPSQSLGGFSSHISEEISSHKKQFEEEAPSGIEHPSGK